MYEWSISVPFIPVIKFICFTLSDYPLGNVYSLQRQDQLWAQGLAAVLTTVIDWPNNLLPSL